MRRHGLINPKWCKYARKGISDLVVILALVAIAIPVALALQGWLGSQASRISSYVATPQVNGVLISKTSTATEQVFVIKLEDTGNFNYSLNSISAKAILTDGTVIKASVSLATSGTVLEPGTSATISVTVGTSRAVKTIVLSILNSDTGKYETINVNVA